MSDGAHLEENVKKMGLNELCDKLEEMDVDFSSLEEEIRNLVLKSINERNSSKSEIRKSQVSSEVMREILERDAKMRKMVADLYTSLLRILTMPNFEKNLGTEMTKEYDCYINTIEIYKQQLERRLCPIVVAGETGAGKSSLLNLIMGEQVLPSHVLSSTSTICQILNSDTPRAEVIKMNGKRSTLEDVTKDKLSEFVRIDRSGESMERYKQVDIYWPMPMLQEHATIVDTPGIGENEEMTGILLNYLTEAVAFIYVINTANAGGVQEDRLGRIFQQQKEFEKKGRLQQFDPECAIFVCNKWDQVPKEEEDSVWEEIARKLKSHWPTRQDMDITKQMFKMSTTEDLRRATAGLGYTDKFKSLLSGIDRLISASLERSVRRHVDWLQAFLDRLLVKVVARINATRKNHDERELMKKEVEKRLRTLKEEVEDVKERMELAAKEKCKDIAQQLTDHLNNQETQNRIFKWHIDDLPDDNDLDDIKCKSKQMIHDKINKEIAHWCQENDIKGTSSHLFDLFIKECKLIKGTYTEIDQIIQGIKPPIANGNITQATETSSDFDASTSRSIFPLQDRIALVAFAPLWLPLVIGGGVVALPVAVGMVVKDVVEEKNKIRHYRENKLSHILKWAEEELKCYSEELVFSVLQQTYLRDFMSSIKRVCENIIPKQIKADKELIENIVKENRDSQIVRQEYTPIERKCKEIVGELLYFKFQNFSEYQSRILRKLDQVGRGAYSTVMSCEVEIGQRQMHCAMKKMKTPLNSENIYFQLTEASNLREFEHKNIVRCYGIAIQTDVHERRYLNVFMELCECSLEDLVLCYSHPMELCDCTKLRRKTCHLFTETERSSQEFVETWKFFLRMLKDILNGLVYLHNRAFVHRDLKLSNILVKDNTAKIADIGLSKPEDLLMGTITATPVPMAPEVFEGQVYKTSADIFSLGIMIWEIWYGRKVFSEEFYRDVIQDTRSIKEHIIGGERPRLDQKYSPPSEIEEFISDCWAAEADNRPTARSLLSRLHQRYILIL